MKKIFNGKIKILSLKKIKNKRGEILKAFDKGNLNFSGIKEAYFSWVKNKNIKAWKFHKKMTLNYAVIFGELKFVLYDDRKDSPTQGVVQELFMSPENYYLVTVPPLIWNGFKVVGTKSTIVANCATIAHDPNEITRKPATDLSIPYDWDIDHK